MLKNKKILLITVVSFIYGISSIAAATLFLGVDVFYDNTKSKLKSTNVQDAIDEIFETVDKNTIKYTEVDLKMSSRTRGYPSDTNIICSTTRTFNENTYVVGMAFDNYYQPTNVASFSFSNNNSVMRMTTYAGYGIGLPIKLKGATNYYIEANVVSGSANISIVPYYSNGSPVMGCNTFIDSRGYKNANDKISFNFKSPTSISNYVIVIRTDQGVATTINNIHLYELTMPF